MKKYKNLSGQSNVDSYDYTTETFAVKFNKGEYYVYSTLKNTLSEIQKMKQLGDAGGGLGTMLASKPYHPHDN